MLLAIDNQRLREFVIRFEQMPADERRRLAGEAGIVLDGLTVLERGGSLGDSREIRRLLNKAGECPIGLLVATF